MVTVAIECSQALLLDKRTPSVLDIIANTAGACLGMLIVAAVESWRGRDRPERMRAAARRDDDADTWAALGIVPPVSARKVATPTPATAQVPPVASESAQPALPSWIPPMPPLPSPLGSAGERSRV